MTTRRAFITGLISFAAAPAIVRAESLMPVKAYRNFGVPGNLGVAGIRAFDGLWEEA
jgi:hypothetical protein